MTSPRNVKAMRPLDRWFLAKLRDPGFSRFVPGLNFAPMAFRTYDTFAPQYDAVMRPLEGWFLARLRAATFRLLPEDARILEIGAGTGVNFVYYPDKAFSIASEPSREMLKIASEKKRPDNVRLIQSCAEQLPFADDCFDAAFATLVFCSLDRPQEAFAELRRVVKSGGTVVLLEHVRPNGLLGPVFDLLNLITVPLFDDHFNRRTAKEAQANGLELIKVERSLLGIINLISCRVSSTTAGLPVCHPSGAAPPGTPGWGPRRKL